MRALITIVSVVLIFAIVGFLGFTANLSKNHHVEAEAVYDRPADMVWQVMTDYASMPTWSPTISKAESLGVKDGKPAWHLEMKDGHFIDVSIDESAPHKLFRTTVLDTDTPYSGSWTLSLSAAGNKTAVKLTQEGTIKSPFWRFVTHYITGEDTAIKQTLAQTGEELAKRPLPAAPAATAPTNPTTAPATATPKP